MQLLDLPNELLLKIYGAGGLDVLAGGAAASCRRLRALSDDPELWEAGLEPQFDQQFLTPDERRAIRDYREWWLRQRAATKRAVEGIDVLVTEMRDSASEDIEIYVWQVLKMRLRVTEALEQTRNAPRTLAHFHWAHWLTEIMFRLEGVHMLLKLSTKDNWGNGIVENPIEHVMALYTLRNGRYPIELFNARFGRIWEPPAPSAGSNAAAAAATVQEAVSRLSEDDGGPSSASESDGAVSSAASSNTQLETEAEALAQHVMHVFESVSHRNDFLAVIGRGSLFVDLGKRLGWNVRLLKLPLGSYVCVQPAHGEAFFVDFQRGGKLRTLGEVRERVNSMATPNSSGANNGVQYGISLVDLLATSYVWHSVPTETRHCVLDLIEHAANDVRVTHLAQHPRLYSNLVRRIITRNIAEVDNAPLSRSVSSASLAQLAAPGDWLRRGSVVRILASNGPESTGSTQSRRDAEGQQQPQGPPSEQYGVVLEISSSSVLVLQGSEMVRVIKPMLQPCSRGKLVSVAGLEVPDIGADMCLLGQYFVQYNIARDRFE